MRLIALGFALLLTGCSAGLTETETTQLKAALSVREGMTVADVGAGKGILLPHLARWAGETGAVLATEIGDDQIRELEAFTAKAGLEQVNVKKGYVADTGLEENCCDVVVLRMVYHHFTEPDAMNASLARTIKPGGRLVVIDFNPSLWMSTSTPDEVPENRGGHGIPAAVVAEELAQHGFTLLEENLDWPGPGSFLLKHYALVFELK
jgi:ubiquinone/menaquinone biosynthesis C-methylase UbiE